MWFFKKRLTPEAEFEPFRKRPEPLATALQNAKDHFSKASDEQSLGEFVKGLLLIRDNFSIQQAQDVLETVWRTEQMRNEYPAMFRMANQLEMGDDGFIVFAPNK